MFCFQYPSSVPDRSTVQTMPYQTTLAAPVPKPFTQSRLRVCGAPISTLAVLSSLSACLPSECWSSRSSSPSSSLGLEFLFACLSACLPACLSIIFSGPCATGSCWRCAAGAGACTCSSAVVSPSLGTVVSETASCHSATAFTGQDPAAAALCLERSIDRY